MCISLFVTVGAVAADAVTALLHNVARSTLDVIILLCSVLL